MKKFLFSIILITIFTCSFTVSAAEDTVSVETASETSTTSPTAAAETKTSETTAEESTAPETSAETTTEYVLPKNLTGTGTVISSERAEDGKIFYTIEADDGSVFYLIIDNDNMQENVYFLSPVTAEDLLSLAKSSNKSDTNNSISSIFSGNREEHESEPEKSTDNNSADGNNPSWLKQNLPFIIIFIVAAAIVAVYYLFKIKPKTKNIPPVEYDGPEELEEDIREDNDEE